MATKKIEIQDESQNIYYPKTSADNVLLTNSITVAEKLNGRTIKIENITNADIGNNFLRLGTIEFVPSKNFELDFVVSVYDKTSNRYEQAHFKGYIRTSSTTDNIWVDQTYIGYIMSTAQTIMIEGFRIVGTDNGEKQIISVDIGTFRNYINAVIDITIVDMSLTSNLQNDIFAINQNPIFVDSDLEQNQILLQQHNYPKNVKANYGPIFTYNSIYASRSGACDIGSVGRMFNDIYAKNPVIQTSDKTQKKDIKSLEDQQTLNFIKSLNPVEYTFVDGLRTHYGLIAQDVEQAVYDNHMNSLDFAGFCRSPIVEEVEIIDENGNKKTIKTIAGEKYGLRYNEFIAPLIKCIQIQQQEIEKLKERVFKSLIEL